MVKGAPGFLFRCFFGSFFGLRFGSFLVRSGTPLGVHFGSLWGSQVVPKWLLRAIFWKEVVF